MHQTPCSAVYKCQRNHLAANSLENVYGEYVRSLEQGFRDAFENEIYSSSRNSGRKAEPSEID